jgi:hypoxanthine phosphoribosyltransferase
MSFERPDNPRILIPQEQVEARVKELAKEIEEVYRGKDLTAICVLRGSFVFFSDLIRNIDLPMACEFLSLSSYGNSVSGAGEVKINLDLSGSVTGKHLLIVEGIIDTGNTLHFLLQILRSRNPASIRVCSLLVKPHSLAFPVNADFFGFQIGDEFVVGYGIDHAEKYRGLSYIGAVERPL